MFSSLHCEINRLLITLKACLSPDSVRVHYFAQEEFHYTDFTRESQVTHTEVCRMWLLQHHQHALCHQNLADILQKEETKS